MAKITKILDSDLPSNIVLSEKGMKTKKIYFRNNGDDINNFYYIGLGNTAILGYNEKEKICLFVDYPEKIFADIYVKLYENNNQISSTSIGMSKGNSSYGRPSGTFCVEFNSPITIESSGISVYCIPEKTIELKPMPKINKLIDSSSFENVSTKLQEINNLLKIGSDNLKTIMDANSLLYEPTDNFSSLVQKLNDKPIKPATLESGFSFNEKINAINGFENVTEIRFEKGTPKYEGVNVSIDGDIRAYIENNVLMIINRGDIFANEFSNYLFSGMYNINKISFNNFNTSNLYDISYMFYNCTNLQNLDLSSFDTSNVDSIVEMFSGCTNLQTLDLSSFDASKVTDMSYMFYNCFNLQNLNLSNLKTANVTNMSNMFYRCDKLQTLDLSSFDTSKVTDMSYMFYNCINLTSSITIMNPNITNYGSMLYMCSSLQGEFIVNYKYNCKNVAQNIVNTKFDYANVILGKQI